MLGAGVLAELSEEDELGLEASLLELESFEVESPDEVDSFEASLPELESFEVASPDEVDSFSLEDSLAAEPFDRPDRLSFL